jgi:hypothetical protein
VASSTGVTGWFPSMEHPPVFPPAAGSRGLDVGVVVEQVLRVVFPLDRGNVDAPSASVTRSRKARIQY